MVAYWPIPRRAKAWVCARCQHPTRMGPLHLRSPFFLWSPSPTPPPRPPPPSPPSKTRRRPPPPPPPPPRLRHHHGLPPPPPLPPPSPFCSRLPLPPPCPPPPGAIRMPLWHVATMETMTIPAVGSPVVSGVASSGRESSRRSPRSEGKLGGGRHFVEHLAPVVVTTPFTSGDAAPSFAGVPPELLPPKKRFLRYHPYAAAWTIQEMANRVVRGEGQEGFGCQRVGVRVPAPAVAAEEDGGDGDDDEGLLWAELRRLSIVRRPALVLTKRLTPSDRSRERARLVLPEALVRGSPLMSMLTSSERHLVLTGENGGLPVQAFDRLGRAYRMSLKRDRSPTCRPYRLTGQWSLFVSRHAAAMARDADVAVEVRAFRPPAWQARLESRGEGGLGMALLLRRRCAAAVNDGGFWSYRERGAADGLLHLAGAAPRPNGDGELQITVP